MRVCVFVRVGETQVEPYANGRARRTDVCAHLYGDRRPSRGGFGGGGGETRGDGFRATLPKHFASPSPVPYGCRGREDPYGAQCQPPCLQPMCSPLDPQTVSKQIGGGGEREGGGKKAENINKIKVFRG